MVLTADVITLSFGAENSEIILGGFGLDLARLKFGCESNTPPAFSAAGKYPYSRSSPITSGSSKSVARTCGAILLRRRCSHFLSCKIC
jgi:hypothetical protein